MLRILFHVAALIFLSATCVFAQSDSTRYINGLPVSEDDTAQVAKTDLDPKNTLTAVAPDELPDKLREVLDKDDQYKGWQDSTVYFQENTGLYLVPVRYEEGVKLFGLSERGHPVTFNEIIISRGQ